MTIDFGFTGQIGGFDFGLVFVVLTILAVAVWLIGLVIDKNTAGKDKVGDTQKGALNWHKKL